MEADKAKRGNYFEDFSVGQVLVHATPRTLTAGDVALYTGLYGPRFAVQSSDAFAKAIGYPRAPVDDLLVFHTVFGKTVPDISLNAVANLGYAECRFLKAVYPGDTLSATSEVIGLRENANKASGVVYVRTTGTQPGRREGARVRALGDGAQARHGEPGAGAGGAEDRRTCRPGHARRRRPASWRSTGYDFGLAGSAHRWGDYAAGEKIDHIDGMTLEEAEHQIATRLYQNTAKVHFNQHEQAQGQFKRRLVYGGVVISLARALSFNGLANAFHIAAINGGRHVAPCFAGDTDLRVVGGAGDGRDCQAAATSARCACGWWRSRTARAPISHCEMPPANTPRA